MVGDDLNSKFFRGGCNEWSMVNGQPPELCFWCGHKRVSTMGILAVFLGLPDSIVVQSSCRRKELKKL